jgi:hypothetical protein
MLLEIDGNIDSSGVKRQKKILQRQKALIDV